MEIFGGGSMTSVKRPASVKLLAGALLALSLLIGYFGLSANGYLVPAAVSLVLVVLLWLGKAGAVVRTVTLLNLLSGTLLVLTLAFGDFLGDRKLDISGVALLANLLTGGPALALVAPALLLMSRSGKALHGWFNSAPNAV